jgi:hypothetical protein
MYVLKADGYAWDAKHTPLPGVMGGISHPARTANKTYIIGLPELEDIIEYDSVADPQWNDPFIDPDWNARVVSYPWLEAQPVVVSLEVIDDHGERHSTNFTATRDRTPH